MYLLTFITLQNKIEDLQKWLFGSLRVKIILYEGAMLGKAVDCKKKRKKKYSVTHLYLWLPRKLRFLKNSVSSC